MTYEEINDQIESLEALKVKGNEFFNAIFDEIIFLEAGKIYNDVELFLDGVDSKIDKLKKMRNEIEDNYECSFSKYSTNNPYFEVL